VPQRLVGREPPAAEATLAAPALRRGQDASPQRLASTS